MIDLHCHILPGIDDGASDIEDSVAMAAQGAADGIEVICATPHIRHDHDVRIGELRWRVEELNAELRRREIPTRVAPGGEVAEAILEHLDDAELNAVALGGGGRWILLEPSPGPLSDSLLVAVEHLGERGFRCVIAHPERHLTFDLEQRLGLLVERGALVQGTAAFLVQVETAEAMLSLARRGLIHVLGSDSHSAHHGRRVVLSDALARLGELDAVMPHMDWIARRAPAAIVGGEEVDPPFAPRPRRA